MFPQFLPFNYSRPGCLSVPLACADRFSIPCQRRDGDAVGVHAARPGGARVLW